jgi:hypothetical protein
MMTPIAARENRFYKTGNLRRRASESAPPRIQPTRPLNPAPYFDCSFGEMTMKRLLQVTLLFAATAVLSGCDDDHERHEHGHSHAKIHVDTDGRQHSHRHYNPGDGAVSLEGDEIVIRAGGQDEDAHVGSDGGLMIGTQAVEVSAAGRSALQRYNAESFAIKDHAVALGLAGLHMGVGTATDALLGVLNGKADHVEEKVDRRVAELKGQARQLCERIETVYTAQETAATEIPMFKPYAILSKKQVQECWDGLDDHDSDDKDTDKDTDGDDDKGPSA